MEKIKDKTKIFLQILLIMLIFMETTLLISYYSHPDMPANILGWTPYIVSESDDVLELYKGDIVIARIPERRVCLDETVSYMDGTAVQTGKIIKVSEKWYLLRNRNGQSYITQNQILGISCFTIPKIGYLLIWSSTDIGRFILILLSLLIVTYENWYYRVRGLLIYIKRGGKENETKEK